ncbi:RidA family protein [Cellulomonas dongxiuzhuiae]|uniref:RidA family protein n=1 Tax=Cellulomonas dongxiuzhuiae TaxID=2819979 RepID=A0ABX8GJ42_9CELL|nr:RidA family protein [Cellulomonas dongxiuzhuiae]MBO3087977.1 RidA family protein [Cellulomonas dongxiuzhuiae]MBO3094671.1 RidA family protein [Cellulomonas dongxiuzhuiae]QWC15676.1 RidA family protein [Cellulomonas dongxiuzhuiae]
MSAGEGRVAARLAELGLTLPDVAAPLAAYVPAVRSGAHVWTSGQLPFVAGALPVTGKLGAEVDVETAVALARTAGLNALAAVGALLAAEGPDDDPARALDRVRRVVKVVGFVASDAAFTGQPAVVNGTSLLLHEVFGDAGIHARSAVGVAVLPMDAPLEIEIVVETD